MKVCGYQWGDCAAEVMAWAHRCTDVAGHRGRHRCGCGKPAPKPDVSEEADRG